MTVLIFLFLLCFLRCFEVFDAFFHFFGIFLHRLVKENADEKAKQAKLDSALQPPSGSKLPAPPKVDASKKEEKKPESASKEDMAFWFFFSVSTKEAVLLLFFLYQTAHAFFSKDHSFFGNFYSFVKRLCDPLFLTRLDANFLFAAQGENMKFKKMRLTVRRSALLPNRDPFYGSYWRR